MYAKEPLFRNRQILTKVKEPLNMTLQVKFELILASNKTALPQLRMSSHYLLPYINMHCTTCNIHVDIHQTRVSNLI